MFVLLLDECAQILLNNTGLDDMDRRRRHAVAKKERLCSGIAVGKQQHEAGCCLRSAHAVVLTTSQRSRRCNMKASGVMRV
jgi:hypothetical protein